MTALTIGEATTDALGRMRLHYGRQGGGQGGGQALRPDRRGAAMPVRRDSLEAGTFEAGFFVTPAKGEPDRLLRMARTALDAGKRARRMARIEKRALSRSETALAGLTASAVRVFEELCALARLNGGRVFPSYDHLARATALGRATVARALAALETAGFLERRRRFRRIEGRGPGPRYAQTSNVYRPALPRPVAALLPRWRQPIPLPADVAQREAEHAIEQTGMRDTLSCSELAHGTAGGALGRVLARLGAAIDRSERESQNDPENLSQSFEKRAPHDGSAHPPHPCLREAATETTPTRSRAAWREGPCEMPGKPSSVLPARIGSMASASSC